VHHQRDASAQPAPGSTHARARVAASLPTPAAGAAQLAVAGLENGACMAYRPTSGDRGRTVFLDAGHGGPDPGTSGSGVMEKDVTLAVELRLTALLRGDGYRVVDSRTGDTSVAKMSDADYDQGALRGSAVVKDLLARIDCANAAKADVLVAIHFNGFDDPTAGGSETFYDTQRTFGAKSQQLAQSLQTAVVNELGLDDRGATPDDQLDAGTLTNAGASYGHLIELGPAQAGLVDRPSTMPGALIEPLFLTSPAEGGLAATAAGQAKVAKAMYDGLTVYLGG
jgi:N-acetylmuramoyl-L-alanine amidase